MKAVDWQAGASGQVMAGGDQLEFATWGPTPEDAPTIVLLHEGLGCVALWRDWPSRLVNGTGCGVLAYSRAGYGKSDPITLPRPLDYMTREAVGALPDLLDRFGLRDIILLGHSDGGTIAAIYAGTVADPRLRGVILQAPHFFTEEVGLAQIRQAGVAFREGDLRAKLSKYHTDPDVAFLGWNGAWLDPGFVDWNVEDAIDGFTVPALVVQGTADPYGTLNQIDAVSQRSPARVERLILPDCGHAPHAEFPEIVLESASAFVRTLGLGHAGLGR